MRKVEIAGEIAVRRMSKNRRRKLIAMSAFVASVMFVGLASVASIRSVAQSGEAVRRSQAQRIADLELEVASLAAGVDGLRWRLEAQELEHMDLCDGLYIPPSPLPPPPGRPWRKAGKP